MKLRISGLMQIIKRELEIISKDFDLIMMLLIAPIFYSLLYGSFYLYKTETEVPIAVLDMDRTVVSQRFISDLNANELLKVTDRILDFENAKDKLLSDEIQGVIIIPKDFESQIKSNKGTEIKLYLNTQRFLPSNDINKAVNEVVLDYSKRARLRAFELKGINPKQAEEIIEPLRDNIKFLFNPATTYGDFLIPAILVLILQQTLFMGLGESIAKERELGTLSNWYLAANHSTSAALTGKGMLYLLIYFCYAIYFFIIDFSLFKINFAGNYFLLLMVTMLFLISMISLSIFAASFFKRKILALQVISFTSYPIFFLTGYAWPDFAMPKSLYWISQLIPSTPFFDIYNRITFTGAGYLEIKSALLHLLILTLAGLALAFYRMRKLFTNN
ncbi:MAG TPA: ABC transporter permease [Ignavibacteriaceae bacterium]|nr:ABC transporter permease [Ignavibacteriaceae bacterium]